MFFGVLDKEALAAKGLHHPVIARAVDQRVRAHVQHRVRRDGISGTPMSLTADSSQPELLFDRGAQWRQSELNGVPYARRRYILIIVAVDVSGAGHLPPSNTGVSCLEPLGEAARGFGNDLQATRDCVHPHGR